MYTPSGLGDLSPGLTFVKSSGTSPLPNFQIGESWSLRITGPSNQPVFLQFSKDGAPIQTQQMGTTDSTGVFTLSGTEAEGDIGQWSETWYVGGALAGTAVANGTNVGSLNFSVVPKPADTSDGTKTTTTTTPPPPPPVTTLPFNLSSVPTVAWIAGAGLLAVLLLKGKR